MHTGTSADLEIFEGGTASHDFFCPDFIFVRWAGV